MEEDGKSKASTAARLKSSIWVPSPGDAGFDSGSYPENPEKIHQRTRILQLSQVFEIGRRYKILNPERMREAYGKMMYVMQDSNSTEISELLEFSCVQEVRTVWDVLLDLIYLQIYGRCGPLILDY